MELMSADINRDREELEALEQLYKDLQGVIRTALDAMATVAIRISKVRAGRG